MNIYFFFLFFSVFKLFLALNKHSLKVDPFGTSFANLPVIKKSQFSILRKSKDPSMYSRLISNIFVGCSFINWLKVSSWFGKFIFNSLRKQSVKSV